MQDFHLANLRGLILPTKILLILLERDINRVIMNAKILYRSEIYI